MTDILNSNKRNFKQTVSVDDFEITNAPTDTITENELLIRKSNGEIEQRNSLTLASEIKVSNWTEYKSAIVQLTLVGGGTISVVADFTVTDDAGFINHRNIIVNGNDHTITTSNANHFKINQRAIFFNVKFKGANYNGAQTDLNSLVFECNTNFGVLNFNRCGFAGCVATNSINGGAALNTPCIEFVSANAGNVYMSQCDIFDHYGQGSGYGNREFVMKSPQILRLEITDFRGRFVNSITGSQSPNAYTRKLRAISGDCEINNDGGAIITGTETQSAVGMIQLGTSTANLGDLSGTESVNYNSVTTDYVGSLIADAQISFAGNSMMYGRTVDLYIDNPSNFVFSLTIGGSTTDILFIDSPDMSASKLNFRIKCLRDYSFTGNDTAFPVLIVEQITTTIPVSKGLVETTNHPANSARNYEVLTQVEYDAIVTPVATTLYFII